MLKDAELSLQHEEPAAHTPSDVNSKCRAFSDILNMQSIF